MDKFKALVHLVIQESEEPEKLGSIKLNKILWFADTETYRLTGNSISGAKYLRRQKGPVPAHILKSIRELKSEGKISVEESQIRYKPRLFTSLKDADESLFSDLEREIVKIVTDMICSNFTAYEISEFSHNDIWDAASDGEEIPLHTTLVKESGDFSPIIQNWATSVVLARAEKGISDGQLA